MSNLIKPPIDCSKLNPISPSFSKATVANRLLSGQLVLHGVSVTHGGCAPADPVFAAEQIASFGINHVRLHHVLGIDVMAMRRFADELHARGIRFSLSLASQVDQWGKPDDFFPALYSCKDPASTKVWRDEVCRLAPLLNHPACMFAVLTNEPCNRIQPADADRFWNFHIAELRASFPGVLFTDCSNPDAWFHEEKYTSRTVGFGQVARQYDLAGAHMYGDDPRATGTGSYIEQPDYWKRILEFGQTAGRPMIINEFGSYASNPHQGSNTAFVMLEARSRGWSVTHYNWCDRPDHDAGGGNAFAILRDPFRQYLTVLGAHLCKYGSPAESEWAGKKYAAAWSKGYGDRTRVEIQTSPTKRLVFGLEKTQRWQWLLRAM